MGTIAFYLWVALLLGISFYKDSKKTKRALFKAWKALENILPEFLFIIVIVGIVLAFFNPKTVATFLGTQSGWLGVVFCSIAGSITLMPGMIAFPTAAMLLKGGAGYMQIGAFISSLMMVGVITYPLEKKYFGKKISFLRNLFAFLFTFLVAWVISITMKGY